MESAQRRKEALDRFIHANVKEAGKILPLKHDASNRRYYRVLTEEGTFFGHGCTASIGKHETVYCH